MGGTAKGGPVERAAEIPCARPIRVAQSGGPIAWSIRAAAARPDRQRDQPVFARPKGPSAIARMALLGYWYSIYIRILY